MRALIAEEGILKGHLAAILLAVLCIVEIPVASSEPPPVFLFSWGVKGTGPGQFESPYDIVRAPDGEVFVLDADNERIQVFTSDGGYVREWGSGGSSPSQFFSPSGVCLGVDGNIYVADNANRRIQKFDVFGNFLLEWDILEQGDASSAHPIRIAASPDGELYVTDGNNHRVKKYDSEGNFILAWGSFGLGSGQFNSPSGIAVDARGDVYVLSMGGCQCVQVFDSEGNYLRGWGSHCRLVTGENCIDPDGPGPLELGDGQFFFPYGIALDGVGNVYVADQSNHRIQKFDESGTFLAKWGSFGTDAGEFNTPLGVAPSPGGPVYVTDQLNHRIQVFGPGPVQGRSTTWGRVKAERR